MPKPARLEQHCKLPPEDYTYATVVEHPDYTATLVAPSMRELAFIYRAITNNKLNPSLVDQVRIQPQ